eukprot:Phypoly_transcript_02108.p1 GENE.Phypoly_transcript_02108~~Phypoly_transcript_02108.p1  ORF type:complete len:192 (-),score=23.44 Phypoly_transcript_02108:86-661(-)
MERGTKQGDIISPTIYLIFMMPLQWTLIKSNCGYKIGDQIISNLSVADNILLVAEPLPHIIIFFNLTKEYIDITFNKIKPNKSAAAFRNSPGFIPIIEGIPFENLGDSKSYRYLGIWINLKLNWDTQKSTSKFTYKNTIKNILNKIYLSTDLSIKLINLVAAASLEYRMQFILFEDVWLTKLQSWTINKIK